MYESEAAFRRAVRDHLAQCLAREQDRMCKEGKSLYQGRWRTGKEVGQLQQQAKKLDRAVLFDMILLYVMITGVIILLCLTIWTLMIPGGNGSGRLGQLGN